MTFTLAQERLEKRVSIVDWKELKRRLFSRVSNLVSWCHPQHVFYVALFGSVFRGTKRNLGPDVYCSLCDPQLSQSSAARARHAKLVVARTRTLAASAVKQPAKLIADHSLKVPSLLTDALQDACAERQSMSPGHRQSLLFETPDGNASGGEAFAKSLEAFDSQAHGGLIEG